MGTHDDMIILGLVLMVLGFLLGIEFNDKAAPVHQALLEQKIITGTSSNPKVLRLLPPLCLQRENVDLLVDALCSEFKL